MNCFSRSVSLNLPLGLGSRTAVFPTKDPPAQQGAEGHVEVPSPAAITPLGMCLPGLICELRKTMRPAFSAGLMECRKINKTIGTTIRAIRTTITITESIALACRVTWG